MKPSLLKSLLVTATFACLHSFGATSPLSAQTAATPKRTYTGTVTQTSAAGVATTGTITINFNAGAKLAATTIINGVTTIYSGELLASDVVLKATKGGLHLTKTVGSLNTSTVLNSPAGTIVVSTGPVPVIVDKAFAYGGLQNADGSALTFRATRDAK